MLRLLTFAFLGMALTGSLATAGIDLSFEPSDTNLLQAPDFSGTTVNITVGTTTVPDATVHNTILNPIDGTEGTACYTTQITFTTDAPDPGNASTSGAFVRITDFTDRHALSNASASGGIGLYVLYDGAAGPMQIGLALREEPVGTANNETYEGTTYKTLAGSPDWQYFHWDYATEIVNDANSNWSVAVALGDGVYDGGDGGDTPQFEAVLLRPIAGQTSTSAQATLHFDDIHTGPAHSPLFPTPPATTIDYTNYTIQQVYTAAQLASIAGVSTLTDLEGVAIDGSGNLIVDVEGTIGADTNQDVIVSVNPNGSGGSAIANLDLLDNDAAAGDFRITGGWIFDGTNVTAGDFQEAAGAQTDFTRVNTSTGASTDLLVSANLEGLCDHEVLTPGTFVCYRNDSNGGDGSFRTLTSAGVLSGVLYSAATQNAGSSQGAIAVNSSGEVYYAANATTDEKIYRIQGLTGTPVATNVTPSTWTGDFTITNLIFTPDDTLIAADRNAASNAVRVWTGTPATSVDIPFATIAAQFGGVLADFSVRDDRGFAVRANPNDPANLVDLFCLNFAESSGPGIGIVKITFGNPSVTGVDRFELYR